MLYCFYIIPARAKSQLLLIFNPYTIPPIAISDMLPDTAIGYVRVFRRTAREKRIARARPLLYDTFMFSRLPFAYATGGLAVILTPFLFWWQESNALFYTLIAVVLVSVVSFVGLSTLSLSETLMRHIIFVLVSVAAGALIGDAFIHLVPEAFADMSNALLPSLLIILGILIFFVLEKFLHWHHEHGEQSVAAYRTYALGEEEKTSTPHAIHPVGKMILVSDGFHNFLDGIIIAVSFIAGTEVGIATTIAVILHEIPQEIGDFGVLMHAGFTKARALFLNFISALCAILGALIAFLLGGLAEGFASFMVPIAAGGFIYIAIADLIPELHKTKSGRGSFIQLAGVLLGVLAMILLVYVE